MKKIFTCVIFAVALTAQEYPEQLEQAIKHVKQKVIPAFVFFPQGSGVLISEDGYILTNDHVRVGSTELIVYLANGKKYVAHLVATDQKGDLSLFKIEPERGERFEYLEIEDSEKIEPGEYVMAIGNPFLLGEKDEEMELEPTITLGIVSAVHITGAGDYDAIQTDASINPGNSGGPLVTLDGKIVGINRRIRTRFGNRINNGVGYAISSAQIKNFLDVMRNARDKRVYRGKISGLLLRENDDATVEVIRVDKDSVAERAGFKEGDIIVKVNDYEIHTKSRFYGVIGMYPASAEFRITVMREAKMMVLKVKTEPSKPVYTGFTITETREPYSGLRIMQVEDNSPAFEAGLRVNDIIMGLDRFHVADAEHFYRLLDGKDPGDEVRLKIVRGRRTFFVTLKLKEMPLEH